MSPGRTNIDHPIWTQNLTACYRHWSWFSLKLWFTISAVSLSGHGADFVIRNLSFYALRSGVNLQWLSLSSHGWAAQKVARQNFPPSSKRRKACFGLSISTKAWSRITRQKKATHAVALLSEAEWAEAWHSNPFCSVLLQPVRPATPPFETRHLQEFNHRNVVVVSHCRDHRKPKPRHDRWPKGTWRLKQVSSERYQTLEFLHIQRDCFAFLVG